MSLDERVSDLIKRIYCASQQQSDWDDIATELLEMVGGHFAVTTVVDLSQREFSSFKTYGGIGAATERGQIEYADTQKIDPTLEWAALHPRAGFCDSAKAVSGEYFEHPFIRWNKARFGSTHWYVGYTPPSDELSFSFSIHIPYQTGAASEDKIRLFRLIFDHMECAVRLQHRPFQSDNARAVLLLDRAGNVRQLSKGAQLLFARPGALSIVDGKLTARCPHQQSRIDQALASATDIYCSGQKPAAVKVHNDIGSPWIVIARPVLNSYGPFGDVEHELHVEILNGVPRTGSLELFQSVFNLTSRELQVVRFLADGHCVDSLSNCLGISPNTARTHLRSIFSKTATTRQSELLQLCSGLCPAED
jgi:DNA-binding CsgD family transcriptional regulator